MISSTKNSFYELDNNEYEDKDIAENSLDSEKNQELLSKLNDWWYETRVASSDNRLEQAIDDDYVDGIQWSDEDVKILKDRNQLPLVFNEIKPTVEWVCGTEKRTRIDWSVLPRTDEDGELAKTKTKLLKYVTDVNKFDFVKSKSFESAVKNGVGWIELGIKNDIEDEPLFIRTESWRNMWLDHLSTETDLSDARYICRSKIMDLDVAQVLFPDRKLALESHSLALNQLSAQADDDYYDSQLYYHNNLSNTGLIRIGDALNASQGRRDVVRLIEMWYRQPKGIQIFRDYGHDLHGEEYDETNKEMLAEINAGHATLFDSVTMEIRVAMFIDGGMLLQDIKSPYKHNRFPFVPVFAYRRGRDNQCYGIVRNSRDPQSDLNKRKSKSLYLLSVNRTIMDKGAVDDIDEYEEEVSRPDAIIEKNPGKELNIETHIRLSEEHLALAREDGEYIRHSSGVTGENLGQETNAASGKAITARQNQGTVVTATLFDNLRHSTQVAGEIMLSLVEQFYADEKVVRLTGERGLSEFTTINEFDYETGEYLNDITETQADFKVSEQDHKESIRQAMFEQMMTMVSQINSDVALNMLDLVFEFSDLPGKDEIVKRIRKMNGQADPDDLEAEQKEIESEQARQQSEQEVKDLARREAEANIRSVEAKAIKDESEGDKTKMESLVKALEAALQAIQAPQAAMAAQELLDGVPMTPTGTEKQQAIKQEQQLIEQQQAEDLNQ